MRTVYKYRTELKSTVIVSMPEGAEILSVGHEMVGDTCIVLFWALVNPDTKLFRNRRFDIYGTGHNIVTSGKDYLMYVGRVEHPMESWYRPLQWHVFENTG